MRPAITSVVMVLLALSFAALPRQAAAWGDEGHEIVGAIAYAHLTPAAKQQVDAFLASDKADKLTAPDFVSRTTWADKLRESDRYGKKIHYNQTHNWHFVDIEIDNDDMDAACNNHPKLPKGTPASKGDPNDCVVDKVDQFSSELADTGTPKAERIQALKFLMHFVGDLHQPLHAADHKDRGGNEVPVLYAKKTVPDNLHAYWDKVLVQRLGKDPKSVAAALDKKITKKQAKKWSKGNAEDWANESYELAKDVSYDFTGEKKSKVTIKDKKTGKSVVKTAIHLDASYDNRALPVVREQLSKGGIRLAGVINDALD